MNRTRCGEVYSPTLNPAIINRVEFYVDDELKATDYNEPYVYSWNSIAFFTHRIKAVAYDENENNAFDEITVWKFF